MNLLVEVQCDKCGKKMYIHFEGESLAYEIPDSHVIPILEADGLESGFSICTGKFKEVQVWQKRLPDRPVGNRFLIRYGELIKKASGERIPVEEPLFLMRGRDHLALPTINEDYRMRCVKDGCNDYILGLLKETASEFYSFSQRFPERMKQPGVTRGK